MIAALFVAEGGAYSDLPDVDPWPQGRDARLYAGPWPVVAHPPCARWGRFWHGSTAKPHQFKMGDDGGCFEAALNAVRRWGGVLEHPAHSHAWSAFGLRAPPLAGGWRSVADPTLIASGVAHDGGLTCHVEQGHYGHLSRKPTWLLAYGTPHWVCVPDSLTWGPSPQRIHPRALELHGYEKARRIGAMAMVGGKNKTAIREATPPTFRDVLIAIAESVNRTCRR